MSDAPSPDAPPAAKAWLIPAESRSSDLPPAIGRPVPHLVLACLQRALTAGVGPARAQAEAVVRLLALRPALPLALARAQVAELLAGLGLHAPEPLAPRPQHPPLALLRSLAHPAWPEVPEAAPRSAAPGPLPPGPADPAAWQADAWQAPASARPQLRDP
jgi:hypothetical protein